MFLLSRSKRPYLLSLAFLIAMVCIFLDPSARADSNEATTEIDALFRKKKWAEAVILLRRSYETDSNDLETVIRYAKALTYSNRREEALRLLIQKASESKKESESLSRRVRVFSKLFLTQKTFALYQEGVNFLNAGKVEVALDQFKKVASTEPANIEIQTRLGQCYVLKGDYDSAAEHLRKARLLNPFEPEVSLWLARALHQRGELKIAEKEMKRAMKGLTTSELAPVWYHELKKSQGKTQDAIRLLQEDLERNPFHLRTLYELAYYEFLNDVDRKGEFWSVRKRLQLALSRLPEYRKMVRGQFESALGTSHSDVDELKTKIESLIESVDEQIKKSG